MKLILQVLVIARIEARFFAAHPRLLLAAAVMVFVPALYALIYLSSLWDPAAHSRDLPVALVNLDQGVDYRGQVFNVGADVLVALKAAGRFGFREYPDEASARLHVREGKLAFALIIPQDFSAHAVPGAEAGGGRPVVFTSEGNNYESAAISRHFAETLGQQINRRLNEQRWTLVLGSAADARRNVERLREGVGQLQRGAQQLSRGATQTAAGAQAVAGGSARLSQGVGQLTSGVKQLGAGLKTMDARLPPSTELERLKSGAETLAVRHSEMVQGMEQLQTGSRRLFAGLSTLREEARDSLFIPATAVEGVEQLADGMSQIDTGLESAWTAQQKLAEGAGLLSAGVGSLTSGVQAMGSGIQTAAGAIPEEALLDELAAGAGGLASGSTELSGATRQLASGAQGLSAGLERLASALPVEVQTLEGSPQGLANSVEPAVETDTAVPNSGSGFAPNVIAGALWLGAGVAALLLHVRVMPRHALYFSRPAKLLGKILLPAGVVVLQVAIVLLMVRYVLKIPLQQPGPFVLTLLLSALTFLLIVFALTRAFGDAGKGLAMILLAVQLTASGGIMPIELSGGLFLHISPWLPLTWVVKAMKAGMFGAFAGDWQTPLAVVGAGGLVALLMGSTVGRWRYVRPGNVRPAVEF